ncbi:MAG TPA: DUF3822 family protein [Agriterribacter sp.]|nr:DUF3822 family protein [Agriterribacter sp.]
MNVAFQIQVPVSEVGDAAQCDLYIEVAADHLLFGVLENNKQEFVALQYVNLDKYNAFNHCKELIYHNEWLSRPYNKVTIVYFFPESLLVPDALFDAGVNKTALDMVYGDLHKGEALQDNLQGWGLHNVYRVPTALHQLMGTHFPKGHFYHAYSILLKSKKQRKKSLETDEITLVFYPNKLLFALFRAGKLQIIQTFDYDTAEDVLYHLLNACQQFDVDTEKVVITVSGLLDDHSSVYIELNKYFLNIELDERPDAFSYNAVFQEHPRHFFTALFNAALCE